MSWSFHARSLGIFGSFVRGEAKKSSDLDLLVEIDDPKMGLLRFIALENYLSDLLGIKVDLVEKQALKPAIGRHVTKEVESILWHSQGERKFSEDWIAAGIAAEMAKWR
ncbi:MAG: nucleotidyltransferase family protein [Methanothrix sp.]